MPVDALFRCGQTIMMVQKKMKKWRLISIPDIAFIE